MFTNKKTVAAGPPLDVQAAQTAQFMAHDLRSALSGVIGGVSLIDMADLNTENQAHFRRVKSSANMLLHLVDSADFSDQSTGEFDIIAALRDLEHRWRDEAENKGLSLRFDHSADLPKAIDMRLVDFQRIFNNLIGNAIKYTDSGSVRVEFVFLSSGLTTRITDSGPGFSQAVLSGLFGMEVYPNQTDKSGSGFGLLIAKQLVERVGGTLSISNNSSLGATAEVTLPKSLLIAKPVEISGSSDLPDLSHLNILLAEDNLTNQMVVTHMLKAMNARWKIASDGVEALEIFAQEDFDLGLIDIEMPRMSGLEVMRAIRAQGDERSKMPLVALTAYVLPEHRERIMAAGADGLISKPLADIAELGRRILSYTDRKPAVVEGAGVPEAPLDDCINMDVYDGLAEMIGQDSMLELLGKVNSDIESVRKGILQGVQEKNTGLIGSNTHILISVAGAIGAEKLQAQAQDLNGLAKTDNWKDIQALTDVCISGINAVLEFVNEKIMRR